MEVSCQLHASAALPLGMCPGTHLTGVLLGPRASLLSCLYRDSNPGPSTPQPTHYTDYTNSFLPSSCIVVTIFTTCINVQDICMLRLFPSSALTVLLVWFRWILVFKGVRWLVARLWLRRPAFNPGKVHLSFMVGKAAVGYVFLRLCSFLRSVPFHQYAVITLMMLIMRTIGRSLGTIEKSGCILEIGSSEKKRQTALFLSKVLKG